MTEQPTLSDGTVTLRPWRDEDDDAAARWRAGWTDRSAAGFVIEHDGDAVGSCAVHLLEEATGALTWALHPGHRGRGYAARAVRVLADWAMAHTRQGGLGLGRVEAKVAPDDAASLRVATRAGLRREGVRRIAPGTGDLAGASEHVILARLATDPPLSEPESFRALLNSFLPRKRAISQMLVRDPDDRVLLCQLTYKQDWDLPGGVVEVGESPQLAVVREVHEELGLELPAGALLLTDWLPAWSGWDDALCLVFDGGRHPAGITETIVKQAREIRSAEFCTPAEVRERCADFTARRIETALANVAGGSTYTESGY